MTDLEDLVRQSFAEQERGVVAAPGLATAVRTKAASRRRKLITLAAAATILGLIVTGVGLSSLRPSSLVLPSTERPSTVPGWQWISSFGLEVPIPKSWKVKDYECSEDTMFMAEVRRACDLSQSDPRPFLEITRQTTVEPSAKPIVVDGHQATIATVRLADGRTQGTLRFVDSQLTVIARLADTALLDRMMNGVRFVSVDHVGCRTDRSPTDAPRSQRDGVAEEILPGTPREVAMCFYVGENLTGSAVTSGQSALALQAALGSAPSGPNPDERDRCRHNDKRPLIVTARYEQGPDVTVRIDYWGCVGRGVDNGARVVHVTQGIMRAALQAAGTTAGYGPDIP